MSQEYEWFRLSINTSTPADLALIVDQTKFGSFQSTAINCPGQTYLCSYRITSLNGAPDVSTLSSTDWQLLLNAIKAFYQANGNAFPVGSTFDVQITTASGTYDYRILAAFKNS